MYFSNVMISILIYYSSAIFQNIMTQSIIPKHIHNYTPAQSSCQNAECYTLFFFVA